jgi:hypothetical protein
MQHEVGADCHGRCAGVVAGHVKSLRACEWGYFVGAYLVGVGDFADDQRGRKLMSDTYTEKLVDLLEYLNKRMVTANWDPVEDESWLTNSEVSGFAYEDAVESLEEVLEDMLSRSRASENDRETFTSYKTRKEQGENS